VKGCVVFIAGIYPCAMCVCVFIFSWGFCSTYVFLFLYWKCIVSLLTFTLRAWPNNQYRDFVCQCRAKSWPGVSIMPYFSDA